MDLTLAGFIITGLSFANDLYSRFLDLSNWEEKDLKVNMEYLKVAIKKGLLPGSEGDYAWVNSQNVATWELKGTHEVVFAINEVKKIKYRLVWGKMPPNVLMRRVN